MANLTQLRILEGLSGLVLVDKPAGIAFASVVKAVKRKFNLVKVGHGGSLDAIASGLFVLAIGDANRFADRLMFADRDYEGRVRFGLRTDTGDVRGRPEGAASGDAPDAERIAAALREFRGDVFQTEPRFCSVRREGAAEYEVADTGEHSPFLAHVYRFEVDADGAFSLRASKGVLPRALVRDLGDALGCGAALESLRRTKVGSLDVKDAIPFDSLLEVEMKDFPSCVTPLSKASL